MEVLADDYKKPEYVPDSMFIPGNIWSEMGDQPQNTIINLFKGREIVFLQNHFHPGHSPQGCWLLVSAEAHRQVMMDTDSFSNVNATFFSRLLGGLTFFPIEMDPPEHSKYRAILTPFFKPKKIAALEQVVRARANELIDRILDRGRCDFVSDFARPLPAAMFLDIMGLPATRSEEFCAWAREAMTAPDVEAKSAALRVIRDYLAEEMESRRLAPRNDTLSGIVNGEVDGRSVTMEEAMGCAVVMFVAGLDTVASQLAWTFRELARNQEMQAELRTHPDRINRANEEFFRYFSAVTIGRCATRDVEVAGAPIKAGDTVCCSMTLACRDGQEFDSPDMLDIAHSPRRHLAFGYGPHTCIGMHLAKLEVKVVLERWLERVPTFRITPGEETPSHGGSLMALDALPLTWG